MAKTAIRRTQGDRIFDIVNTVLLVLIALICIYPIYFTVIASLSNPYDISKGKVFLWPSGFTIDAYRNILINDSIWTGYGNSILYSVTSTLYQLALTIPAGYVMSRKRLVGRNVLMVFFMFTMYFGGGMIPSYLLIRDLHMLNTRWVMIVGGMSVYNMIITRTFFQNNLPDEMVDAATIDGANHFRIFAAIAVPVSAAIISVIALYCFVGSWNSYFGALLYIHNREYYPLQLVLRNILILNQEALKVDTSLLDAKQLQDATKRALMAEGMKYSIILISSLPTLIAYPLVQRHFVKGVMIGAVKG